ncbi:chitin synthase [Phakopsora pachyrhizi]|nr:chitin synthase [Phakopsora pachyrhizi]
MQQPLYQPRSRTRNPQEHLTPNQYLHPQNLHQPLDQQQNLQPRLRLQHQRHHGQDSSPYLNYQPPAFSPQSPPALRSPQPNLSTSLSRGKTLTRPERHVNPAPLIDSTSSAGLPGLGAGLDSRWSFSPWSIYVRFVTLPIPSFALTSFGIKDPVAQQAWREKIGLCSIALIAGAFTGFVTIGMNKTLCPQVDRRSPNEFLRFQDSTSFLSISGWAFNASKSTTTNPVNFRSLSESKSGLDITPLFDRNGAEFSRCKSNPSAQYARSNLCESSAAVVPAAGVSNTSANTACFFQNLNPSTLNGLSLQNTSRRVGYTWDQVALEPSYLVLQGMVLNLKPYLTSVTPNSNDPVDRAIRSVLSADSNDRLTVMGKDVTRMFTFEKELLEAVPCLIERYRAGYIDKLTPGCFVSQLFLYVSLVVILGVVLVRFFMAVFFNWFISDRLTRPPRNLRRKVISPAILPSGANLSLTNKNGAAPWVAQQPSGNSAAKLSEKSSLSLPDPSKTLHRAGTHKQPKLADSNGLITMASIGAELFCVCLVTCYSEGAEGIRKTLDSISSADYSDARKLLFVVCDGMITGSGEKMSTPDICVGLLEADPRFQDPMPMSYKAVASGPKQHNQAMVYAGHYTKAEGRRTPMVVVVKSGTPSEAVTEKKPGNRGKRDSQMILMNFFSRVTYNDRMSPLDYDLFRKIHALMGVTPDFFEVCLMVDADTTVQKDSISHMVNCMQHDHLIMGLCGETRIANKRQSWVTAIQVFEYYISHHLAKGFESVFGGVTCLPGCFSMYRLKARRSNDGDWVPILSQPEICREYSQSTVLTLHQKNLLLLGEDRFLTTLMIRTFPSRKMMFCPQARCRTIVPDEFSVLVSQRRRWINSTIHNLMELVRVPNLCGTFCFSMQFVVFMELMGTIVLPIAITLTYSLIINSIIHPPQNFADAIPLILLAAILGLPAVLILVTSRKISYVFWMLVYLIALPVWNFVLPLYAFWHFDDFSWGETRKVEGEAKGGNTF